MRAASAGCCTVTLIGPNVYRLNSCFFMRVFFFQVFICYLRIRCCLTNTPHSPLKMSEIYASTSEVVLELVNRANIKLGQKVEAHIINQHLTVSLFSCWLKWLIAMSLWPLHCLPCWFLVLRLRVFLV